MTDNTANTGLALRTAVLGAAYAEGSMQRAQGDPVAEDYQALINRFVWGSVWAREGLDLKTRSAITLTVLALRGQTDELKLHISAAKRNGFTHAELQELFVHLAAYAGVPVGNYGFKMLATENGNTSTR